METIRIIRVIIESRLENCALVGAAVRGIAEMLSMDATGIYHLELCAVEAVTNVIKHAYHCEAGHSLEMDIQLYPDRLTMQLRDCGERIDLSKIKPFQFDPRKVEMLPERGMGTFILKNLMDEINYEVVQGRNILTMSKHLNIEEPTT
ncbi:MAG: ATP-binding protein [Desulfobacterales bacterium]